MLVVEHDLAILDLLTDALHVAYGEPGAYGIVTSPKSTKGGINEYLEGYLDNENMRIRQTEIEFEEHAPRSTSTGDVVIEYPDLVKSYGEGEFSLEVEGGSIREAKSWASSARTASASPRSPRCSPAASNPTRADRHAAGHRLQAPVHRD